MYTKYLNFHIFDSGPAQAEENMALDARLLSELDPNGAPLLHLYEWSQPSATYGHFITPSKHIDLERAAMHRLSLGKRPTGGGIVFHIWDLAFSFLMPSNHPLCSQNTLENYRFVNEVVKESVSTYLSLGHEPGLIPEHAPEQGPNCTHFCMARPTIYDVVYRGQKIAGAAQRRTKSGYLHQGTISLALPDLTLLHEVLRSKEEIASAMQMYSFAPLGAHPAPDVLTQARRDLQELLKQNFLAKIR